jgi:long-chain acyl-CoA synthetase
LKFGPEDVHLSYLPLAHVFERVVMGAILGWGARVGFYQGDATKLLDDIGTRFVFFF